MEIECEKCGGVDWKLVYREKRIGLQRVSFSALKCKKCGIAYVIFGPVAGSWIDDFSK